METWSSFFTVHLVTTLTASSPQEFVVFAMPAFARGNRFCQICTRNLSHPKHLLTRRFHWMAYLGMLGCANFYICVPTTRIGRTLVVPERRDQFSGVKLAKDPRVRGRSIRKESRSLVVNSRSFASALGRSESPTHIGEVRYH
jgi:hypothetical protein